LRFGAPQRREPEKRKPSLEIANVKAAKCQIMDEIPGALPVQFRYGRELGLMRGLAVEQASSQSDEVVS
jgi:hypothetical protein